MPTSNPVVLSARIGLRKVVRIARMQVKRFTNATDPWYDTEDTCDDPAIFVGGSPRSGTTLLREILNRHPRIACGAETSIFSDLINPPRLAAEWGLPPEPVVRLCRESTSAVRFAETFFREFMQREGKSRWADKTPANVLVFPRILKCFPNAKVVHLLRDGRDVACSLRKHPRSTIRHGKIQPVNSDNPIKDMIRRWVHHVPCGLAFRDHPRCYQLRYEDLILNSEATLRSLCEFLGEEYHPAMLDPSAAPKPANREARVMNSPDADSQIKTSSVGRWRRDLTPQEKRDVARIAGELLIATGYAKDHSWVNEN